MTDKSKLKCVCCNSILKLNISFDGCDWESKEGEGSGFDYEISLLCADCGRIYPIGRVKNSFDFCENSEYLRPYDNC